MSRVKIITVGLVKDAPQTETGIAQPADILPLLEVERNADREHFLCFHLDARNKVNAFETVHIGSLNASIVHPREVFKSAILNNAASIILAHTHPSGDPTPSGEDIQVTRRIKQAGELLGIEVLDHIIASPNSFLSMRESNLI